jgi:CubicO group peptidase (beta-lactamase class C family)
MNPIQRYSLVLLAFLAAASLLPTAAGQPADAPLPATGATDQRLAPFDAMMIDFLKKHPNIPGAALAVARDGEIVYNRGFGMADGKLPVRPKSRFRIASISKPITAVAILQLIERGKLKLDDKVFDVLDLDRFKVAASFDARWRDVTIQQLMHHTAGFDRSKSFDPMFISERICSAFRIEPPAVPKDIIRYMLRQPLDFNPGGRYAYSNFGYSLLGRVIEKLSGRTYEDYVRREVLLPVGASDTFLGKTLAEDRLPDEVHYFNAGAAGLAILGPQRGTKVPVPYGAWSVEAFDSHGGWVSTASDLVRFGAAFDRPESCRILSAKSIETMFACPPGPAGHKDNGDEKSDYYGCGWNVRPLGKLGRNTWHNGQIPGTSTILVRRGKDNLTWAVLFNGHASNKAAATVIDPLVHVAADAVTEWP